jgi:hypothetical protein
MSDKDNTYLPPDATIPGGVSDPNSEPDLASEALELEHSKSNYESTLKGVALARHHLQIAQQKAVARAEAYAYELQKKIDEEQIKRLEVLNELKKIRDELGKDPALLWEAEAPQSDNPELDNYDPTFLNETEHPNE